MCFYGRIIIPFLSFSSQSRNSKKFTHSDFKMALIYAIMGSIAATALKFINNVRTSENRNFIFECEKIDQVALNRECNSKYGYTIIKSFIGTVLTTAFHVNTLFKNYFIHLSRKSRG